MGKRKGKSPVQRTLEYLKKKNIRCQKVEYWNSFGNKRVDLFGIIDIIALTPDGVLGIQVCGRDFQEHIRKMTLSHCEETQAWLQTPGTGLVLWSWRPLKKGKRILYKPRVRRITEADLLEDMGD